MLILRNMTTLKANLAVLQAREKAKNYHPAEEVVHNSGKELLSILIVASEIKRFRTH